MEKPNLQSQGMLKMLQDLYLLLKNGKQEKACNIRGKIGLELKYWTKLTNNNLIINTSAARKPVYKWNTIEPNMYMALETLKDYPQYCDFNVSGVEHEPKDLVKEYYKATQICWHCGKIFPRKRKTAKFCSDLCRVNYSRKKGEITNEDKGFLFETSITPKQEHIIPPKIEWVRDYCEKRKNGINPASFMDYYNRNGWMVKISGKMQQMLNWRAAIHTWEANQKRPIQVKQVVNTKDIPLNQLVDELELRGFTGIGIGWIADDKLLVELKKRGYSGDINKKIQF